MIKIIIWHPMRIYYVDQFVLNSWNVLFNPIWISSLLYHWYHLYSVEDNLWKQNVVEKYHAIAGQYDDILLMFCIYVKDVELVRHLESHLPTQARSVLPRCDYWLVVVALKAAMIPIRVIILGIMKNEGVVSYFTEKVM